MEDRTFPLTPSKSPLLVQQSAHYKNLAIYCGTCRLVSEDCPSVGIVIRSFYRKVVLQAAYPKQQVPHNLIFIPQTICFVLCTLFAPLRPPTAYFTWSRK